ncbi:MAG: protein-L-isoaspartate(D-aspartate) O-methyltransferase [Desulfobacterales bacterium]|nr:protein-L-isoaspartate(D-aspartate) O-methyltransferase [Desulfobacterales bacterium]
MKQKSHRQKQSIKYLLVPALAVIFLISGLWPWFSAGLAPAGQQEENDFRRQRMEMIRQQIKSRGIDDPEILAAFEKVKRHRFVPERVKKFAYQDRPLPIGEGQTISQPYIVALMTSVIDPGQTDKVLEIGTGSGYQAAILAELCKQVYTIEIIGSLGKKARQTLSDLGYDNVAVKIGDGYKGWPEHAPYDAIIVTCAPTEVPEPLKDQLAEGGRLVIPVGENYDQNLVLFEKKEDRLLKKNIIPVLFVPMVDEEGKQY